MMERVMIIGSPGAGKSTFARKLWDLTGLPLYYLDMIWHRKDHTNVTEPEFDSALFEITREPRWIIDGNYLRTMKIRLDRCDTCFLLDFPVDVCIEGAKNRAGKKREDIPWDEDTPDPDFFQYIADFPSKQLTHVYELLKKYENKQIIVFHSRQESEEYLRKLEDNKQCSEK